MLNLDIDAAIRQGLAEIFSSPEAFYFDVTGDIQDVIDGFVSIFTTCQLRSDAMDSETAGALDTVNRAKVERLRKTIKAVASEW